MTDKKMYALKTYIGLGTTEYLYECDTSNMTSELSVSAMTSITKQLGLSVIIFRKKELCW